MKALSREELLKIAASLEDYHRIFYTFWEMSSVYFSDEVPTAAVRFSPNAKPQMILNEAFWNRHNFREQLFIICHECMHALLDHGIRDGMNIKGATHSLVNKAQDITINHMIVDLFNYDRNDLREWKKYCWIETCFTYPETIARNENFIYYLEKLIEDPKTKRDEASGDGPQTVDQHSAAESETEGEKKGRENAAQQVVGELDPKTLEDLLKALPPGSHAGTMKGIIEKILDAKLKAAHLNFKLIIKKLKRTQVKYVELESETFIKEDRRFNGVLKRRDMALPGRIERQGPKKDRLLTALFMDVSGSCMNHFEKFQQIALAFDAEREIFDLRTFIFDTTVTEIKPNMPIRIGGGTYFHIIEQKVLELEREYHRYPDCVVVVTDGEGDAVKPKGPKKWIWLLTPPGRRNFLPLGARSWLISQVEFT